MFFYWLCSSNVGIILQACLASNMNLNFYSSTSILYKIIFVDYNENIVGFKRNVFSFLNKTKG